MWDIDLESLLQRVVLLAERLGRRVDARAWVKNGLVALLVQHQCTQFTLVPLLAKAPQEVLAVGTEGGLPEESSDEAVVVYNVHLPPLHGAPAPLHHLLLHKFFRGGRRRHG